MRSALDRRDQAAALDLLGGLRCGSSPGHRNSSLGGSPVREYDRHMFMLDPDPHGEEREPQRPRKVTATILVLLLVVAGIVLSLLTGAGAGGGGG
jgi:hypothetical protein